MSLPIGGFCKDFRERERLDLNTERWIILDRLLEFRVGATIYASILERRKQLSRGTVSRPFSLGWVFRKVSVVVPSYLWFHFAQFVTCSQPRHESIEWNISEINNSYILNCVPFWVTRWTLMPSCSVSPGMWIISLMWIIPLSNVSVLYRSSPVSHLVAISILSLTVMVLQCLFK